MKYIDSKKFNEIVSKDFDTIREITGELGDKAWDDEDVEMLMEKHGLTGEESYAIIDYLAYALHCINLIGVKEADKGTAEVLTRFNLGERDMNVMYTYVWGGICEGIKDGLIKSMKSCPADFVASLLSRKA